MAYQDGVDLLTGTMYRAEDDWHDPCAKPSLVVGEVFTLSETGVTHWGYVRGCSDCDYWVWTRLDGKVLTSIKVHKDVGEKGEQNE